MKTKLIITGTGGQGVQTIAKILARAAAEGGAEASYIPQFGVEQRGAPSVAFVIIDEKPVAYPLFQKADLVFILHAKAEAVVKKYIFEDTQVFFDDSLTEKYSGRLLNLFVLGKISRVLNLPKDSVWRIAQNTLGKKFKTEEIKKESRSAFQTGYDEKTSF